MVVGLLEIRLFMEGNSSLKGKRKVVKSLLGKVKSRFNAAASEVEDQDALDTAVIGFAVCGSDAPILDSVLSRILRFVEEAADAEVVDSWMECQNLGPMGEGREE
jgi:uncharacterized protein YlxP (DUF503 family)